MFELPEDENHLSIFGPAKVSGKAAKGYGFLYVVSVSTTPAWPLKIIRAKVVLRILQ